MLSQFITDTDMPKGAETIDEGRTATIATLLLNANGNNNTKIAGRSNSAIPGHDRVLSHSLQNSTSNFISYISSELSNPDFLKGGLFPLKIVDWYHFRDYFHHVHAPDWRYSSREYLLTC
jgi:hypothetical protein